MLANLTVKSRGDMFFSSVVKCAERAGRGVMLRFGEK